MWRLLRLSIKCNQCQTNQSQFRVIGTTCANADCDDKCEEVCKTILNKENYADLHKKNLASKAAQEYHNFLRQNPTSLHHTKIPFNYEPQKLKVVDNSLKEIQWDHYSRERSKVFLKQSKRVTGKFKGSNVCEERKRKGSTVEKKESTQTQNDDEEKRFGTLSKNERKFEFLPSEKDYTEENPLKDDYEKRLSIHQYGRKILALCQERKLKEALEVFEVEMKVQKAIPDNYCYNILINACGKAGYTKKAFDLYYQMKRRGLKVEKFAYTGLFNACANCPFKLTEGLQYAQMLRKHVKDQEVSLHPISYHAMIKAFGRCGDIETAFEIVDEMLERKHNVSGETMNFLLQACVSDKESGFRHALMVWRKMRTLQIPPCIFSYNLLMRCVKECKAGDPRLLSELLEAPQQLQGEEPPSKSKSLSQSSNKKLSVPSPAQNEIEPPHANDPVSNGTKAAGNCDRGESRSAGDSRAPPGQTSVHHISDRNEIVRVDLSENMEMEVINDEAPATRPATGGELPNVLSRELHPGNAVAIASLETKEERLCMLRGMLGLLESMVEDRVKPTVTTFTFMLECLPPSRGVEEMLVSSMEKCGIVPDVVFCNKLIHRRALRMEDQDAKAVLELLQKHRLCADLVTFGCLALACRSPADIDAFLADMDKAGFTPNEEIMTSLLRNTLISQEYAHAIEILRRLQRLEIRPSEGMLAHLENTRKVIRQRIIKREKEGGEADSPTPRERRRRQEMRLFLMEYKHWLKRSRMAAKDHPWAQFGYEDKRGAVAGGGGGAVARIA